MKPSLRPTGQEVGGSALAVEAVADVMTIVGTRVSRASRAGSLSDFAQFAGHYAGQHQRETGWKDCECQEADQHLPSVRRNKHGNRNSVKSSSAGTSASRRNRKATPA